MSAPAGFVLCRLCQYHHLLFVFLRLGVMHIVCSVLACIEPHNGACGGEGGGASTDAKCSHLCLVVHLIKA